MQDLISESVIFTLFGFSSTGNSLVSCFSWNDTLLFLSSLLVFKDGNSKEVSKPYYLAFYLCLSNSLLSYFISNYRPFY